MTITDRTSPATADQLDLGVPARVTAGEPKPRRLTSAVLWAAQTLLAAFFVFFAALPKLTGGGSHGAVQEFGLIGAGQWFRYLVGTLELAGAIGLLTPWLAGPAAAGLAADMAGATIVNATVLNGTRYDALGLTAILFAVFVILTYGRRQQIKNLAAAIRR
jgi:uncharacterized membrane protein YphA (DoxX/SURF4 family)